MVNERKLPGIPPGGGSFTHGEAVANAHLAAFAKAAPAKTTFSPVSTPIMSSLSESSANCSAARFRAAPGFVVKTIGRINALVAGFSGREPDITPEGATLVCEHPRLTSSKAKDELNFETVPLRTMVEDSFNWLKQEGMLTAK